MKKTSRQGLFDVFAYGKKDIKRKFRIDGLPGIYKYHGVLSYDGDIDVIQVLNIDTNSISSYRKNVNIEFCNRYTQEECYKILYDREKERIMSLRHRPSTPFTDKLNAQSIDKISRVANIFAVQNTWELFNNQDELPDDIVYSF